MSIEQDIWIKSTDFNEATDEKFDDDLFHNFGDMEVLFRIRHSHDGIPAAITCEHEGTNGIITYVDNTDEAKTIVNQTINHFDKLQINYFLATQYETPKFKLNVDINEIRDYLKSYSQKLNNQKIEEHNEHQLETARKTGYIEGVCECVAALGDNHTLGKKLLSEMGIEKEMVIKYANPKTYKKLEKGIFTQKQEQNNELTNNIKR